MATVVWIKAEHLNRSYGTFEILFILKINNNSGHINIDLGSFLFFDVSTAAHAVVIFHLLFWVIVQCLALFCYIFHSDQNKYKRTQLMDSVDFYLFFSLCNFKLKSIYISKKKWNILLLNWTISSYIFNGNWKFSHEVIMIHQSFVFSKNLYEYDIKE